MEKYKFKLREIKETIVEIEAKNKKEVIKKLAGYLATDDENFCKKISKTKEKFNIILNEISSETRRTIIDDYDEINEDIIRYLITENEEDLKEYDKYFYEENDTEDEENILEDDDEIEDDLPEEYTEICCENCRYVHTY